MKKTTIIIITAVGIVILLVAAYFWLIPRQSVEEPVFSAVSDITPEINPLSNPVGENLPELNPVEKTNPFKDIYKNPFE